MDHHTLMTKSTLVNQVMQKIVRQLSGLGKAPTRASRAGCRRRAPSGSTSRSSAVGQRGWRRHGGVRPASFLVDEQAEPGGQLLTHPAHGLADATARADAARAAGACVARVEP